MPVNTSISPYFDDYSEDKNFHRVLFKPGVAVQSRELTQSQTILQNQVKRVGDYLFKDGDKVTGPKSSLNLNARSIRLLGKDIRNNTVDITVLKDTYVTSAVDDIIGYVDFVFEKDDPNIGDDITIVINLKKYNSTNNGIFPENTELYFYKDYTNALNKATPDYTALASADTIKNAASTLKPYSTIIQLTNPSTIIQVGDEVVHSAITKKIYVTEIVNTTEILISESPGATIGGENVQYIRRATCPTSILTQDSAVFYKNGFFVKSKLQKIVPDKYTSFPSKLVAFLVDEIEITSNDDLSLLDPALGSSNYFASGADRLQINLSIASLNLNADYKADTTQDYIGILKLNKGEIEYIKELSSDSTLQDALATRTYDQAGSYVTKPFLITPSNTLESDTELVFKVSSGKGYVGGYPVSTIGTTEVRVPKNTLTETKTNYSITTTQGNYLKISNVSYRIPNFTQSIQGESFLELHNVRHPANSTSMVGMIGIKSLEYDTSLGNDTQFRMFYRYLALQQEVPATWEAWANKYSISSSEGQYIANVLYTNNSLLGNYGPAAKAYYGLFREPDVSGVAFWWNRWQALGRDIAKVKSEFALSIPTSSSDYSRVVTNSKSFLLVDNSSPFIDGLQNVNKVRSIVGVTNSMTSHYTSCTYASPFFYADIADSGINTNGDIVIFDPRPSDRLIFDTNKGYVKNLDNIRTSYNKVIQNAIFAGGKYTKTLSIPEKFPLGDGVIPSSTARTNFIVLVKSGATANVKSGIFNFETKGSVTIQGDSATAVIDLGDPGFTGLADIEYTIENDSTDIRTKTLNYDQGKIINITQADKKYSIGYADIYKFNGVYKLANLTNYLGVYNPTTSYYYNDLVLSGGTLYKSLTPTTGVSVSNANAWGVVNKEKLSNYILNDGQTDSYYDHGYVKFVGGASAIPGNVLISFSYFSHSGDGPLTVNSYPIGLYSKISRYTSIVDAKPYNLRDCIDFRPKRTDNSAYLNFDPAVFPTSAFNTESDITYYLGRRDRIYVTNTLQNYDSPYNSFYVVNGTQTANPSDVTDESDLTKLSLATLEIPPYCISSFDVKIVYDDNRRFTMRDIGKIQSLTVNLDKAIKLQAIEINNLKGIITNTVGDSLLKSGIFIDDFSSLDKAELLNGFTSVINTSDGTCFPIFAVHNIDLSISSSDNVYIQDDLITMKYVDEVLASQLEANGWINVNPGAINDGRGRAVTSKKNSFAVNLFITGGLLLGATIAAKVYSAYNAYNYYSGINAATVAGGGIASEIAAYNEVGAAVVAAQGAINAETVLAAAWGAVRDLPGDILKSFDSIDAISKISQSGAMINLQDTQAFVTDYFTRGRDIVTDLSAYSFITKYSETKTALEATYQAAIGTSTLEAYNTLTGAISAMVDTPSIGTAFGVIKNVSELYNSIGTVGFQLAAQGIDYAVTSLAGAGILSIETAATISGYAASGLAAIEAIPFIGPAIAVAATIAVASAVVNYAVEHPKQTAAIAILGYLLFSDLRTKKNIVYEGTMKNGLKLYSYEYKDEFKSHPLAGPGKWYGVMAQDVEDIYPNAIRYHKSGYKAVDYSAIGI